MHRKLKYYLMLGAPIMVGGVLLGGGNVHAATLTPSITITATPPSIDVTKLELKGANKRAEAEYTIPVRIDYKDVKDLTVAVYATNDMSTTIEQNKTIGGVAATNNTTPTTNIISGMIENEHEVIGGVSYEGTVSMLSYDSNSHTVDPSKKLHSIPLDTQSSISDMNNEWGYRHKLADTPTDISTESYTAMPSANTTNKVIERASIKDNTMNLDAEGKGTKYLNLGFAAGINSEQESGNYGARAIVSVVASANYLTLFDITDMQDPNIKEACENTPWPSKTATTPATSLQNITYTNGFSNQVPEVGLKDTRDDKVYKIAKLADGNCWMIQNLALEGETVITPEKSDIQSGSYTLPASEYVGKFTGVDVGFMYNGSYQPNSYNTQGFIANASYPNGIPTAGQGECNSNSNSNTGCNGLNSGSYYSWLAATAGTGSSVVAQYTNAPASICPKGWRLPTSSDQTTNSPDPAPVKNGQAQTLYDTYGDHDIFSMVWSGADEDDMAGTLSGIIDAGTLHQSGVISNWSSSTAIGSDAHVYILSQGTIMFSPATYDYRSRGASVRCVAR